MPKISIIVPIYNSENYLDKCLTHLINQTLEDIEIILVNDGSTDNSETIINKYIKDSRIKYFKKKNGGQASARNLGLSKASGEYVLFSDSDDYIEKNTCEKLYNLTKDGYDIICFDYYLTNVDDNYKVISEKVINVFPITSCKINNIKYLMGEVCPWNKLFKRDFLIANNFKFPEGIIYEDYASIPTLINYDPDIYYYSHPFVHYVQTDSSTMRSDSYKKKYEDIFKANKLLYNALVNNGYNNELEFLISYHLLYLGSLNFYKYNKLEMIDKISDYMHKWFPKYNRNMYIKKLSFKNKVLMNLFFRKKYNVIKFIQNLKGVNYGK